MNTHRAPLEYRHTIPLAIVALLLAFAFGCSTHEVPPTRPPAPVLTSPRIVYSRGPYEGIFLLDPATGKSTNFPNTGPHSEYPVISPDGTRIAFTRAGPTGFPYIVTMAVDGSDMRPWAHDSTTSYWFPRWSPDGEHIMFTWIYRTGMAWDVYVARSDGSERQRVTTDGRSYSFDWSPDGTRLLTARNGSHELVTYAPDGSDMRVLAQDSIGGIFGGADYSPDGARIVLSDTYTGRSLLETMSADGSNLQVLMTTLQLGVLRPSWSPDGQAIVYEAWEGSAKLFIYRLGAQEPVPLFTDASGYGAADWGPKP